MEQIMSLTFINYRGEVLPLPGDSEPVKRKKKAPSLDSFHKGFRVVGVPILALTKAEKEHQAKQSIAAKKDNETKPFDANHWLMSARKRAIRSKPYEVPEAAQVCAELALKAGWLAVEIREIKREADKTN